MDRVPIEEDEDLHNEIEELREDLLQAEIIIKTLREKLRKQKHGTQQLVVAWKTKLRDLERETKQKEQMREKQLQNITSSLYYLEGQLRKEKKEIELLLQEKDRTIENQRQTIEKLKQECDTNQTALQWKESQGKYNNNEREREIFSRRKENDSPAMKIRPSYARETSLENKTEKAKLPGSSTKTPVPLSGKDVSWQATEMQQKTAMFQAADHDYSHQNVRGDTWLEKPYDERRQYGHYDHYQETFHQNVGVQKENQSPKESKYLKEHPAKISRESPRFQIPSSENTRDPSGKRRGEIKECYTTNRSNAKQYARSSQDMNYHLAKDYGLNLEHRDISSQSCSSPKVRVSESPTSPPSPHPPWGAVSVNPAPSNPIPRRTVSGTFPGLDPRMSPLQVYNRDGSPRWSHQSTQSSSVYYDDNDTSSSSNSSYENVFSSPGVYDPVYSWNDQDGEEGEKEGAAWKRKAASLPAHPTGALERKGTPAHRTASCYSQGYEQK
ncbi:uncharacterized protein LOC106180762 [Lingula anatina]|uniref:Uncharacterized protein LOC106180762 n=1 Tax=Lingula anatina TaxID=7574 RepID=A0A1S3KDI6_LINAN|nr:uncharacterized protein LOC106180762 [Lingula anatina]|eukprot:XP_013420321.1 uncharacterized protein LOC106180762 [Lingula anatina]